MNSLPSSSRNYLCNFLQIISLTAPSFYLLSEDIRLEILDSTHPIFSSNEILLGRLNKNTKVMGCAGCHWTGRFSVLLPRDSRSGSGVRDVVPAGTRVWLGKTSPLVWCYPAAVWGFPGDSVVKNLAAILHQAPTLYSQSCLHLTKYVKIICEYELDGKGWDQGFSAWNTA